MILIGGVAVLFWLIVPRLQHLGDWLFYAAAIVAALFLLVVTGGLFLLFLSALTACGPWKARRGRTRRPGPGRRARFP